MRQQAHYNQLFILNASSIKNFSTRCQVKSSSCLRQTSSYISERFSIWKYMLTFTLKTTACACFVCSFVPCLQSEELVRRCQNNLWMESLGHPLPPQPRRARSTPRITGTGFSIRSTKNWSHSARAPIPTPGHGQSGAEPGISEKYSVHRDLLPQPNPRPTKSYSSCRRI